jgi:hypothetical protein
MPVYPQILEAVKRVRTKVRWKPNSAENHLRKRKMRGHLPQEATITDYEGIILKLIRCGVSLLVQRCALCDCNCSDSV